MPPETLDGVEDKRSQPWRTEYDVVSTLRAMGHEAWPIGVGSELGIIRKAIHDHKPHVAFNLLEEFDGYPLFDQHVVSYLELHEAAVYGLQSSRADSRPRQGSNQEGDGIPSHPRAAFRSLSAEPQWYSPASIEVSAVRQISERRRFSRHRSGIGGPR